MNTQTKREAVGVIVRKRHWQPSPDGDLIKLDSMLMLRRSANETSMHGLWELPGGKIEGNETIWSTAANELQEETGLNSRIYTLADFTHETHNKKYHFAVANHEGDLHDVTLSDEHDAYAWMTVQEILERPRDKISHHLIELIRHFEQIKFILMV